MKHYIKTKLYGALSLLFLNQMCVSANLNNLWIKFPLPPRATLEVASGNNTFAYGDAMVPLIGNDDRSIYVDITGKYGDDQARLGSVGLGIRNISYSDVILGAYFFGDFNRTPNKNNFRVLNPGVEIMTNYWDGHLNGYFPTGDRNRLIALLSTDKAGNSVTFFHEHEKYQALFDLIENVGAGADLEIGYTSAFLRSTRFFAGGYHFSPKYTGNINGLEIGFETPLKNQHATLKLQNSYDNLEHNTFLISLQINLGGLDKTDNTNIHNRMLDLIPRHRGDLQTGDGIPSQKTIVNKEKTQLLETNIWFFNPDDAQFGDPNPVTNFSSCTYEHPCLGLDQIKIDTINSLSPNAKLYLSSGVYINPNVGFAFSLRNGQEINGRTPDFSEPAQGLLRPLLNDSLFLEGNNKVYNIRTIGHSVRPLSTGGSDFPFQLGALVRSFSVGDVYIRNSDFTTSSQSVDTIGLANNSSRSTLNVANSSISSFCAELSNSIAAGVGNLNTGDLNISDSVIYVSSINTTKTFDVAIGVINNESGNVNIDNSSITVGSVNGGFTVAILNNSSLGLGLSQININNSTFNISANNSDLVAGILNQANNATGEAGTINVTQSHIQVSLNDTPGGIGSGVISDGNGTINVSTTSLSVSGNSGNFSGITVANPSATVNLLRSVISLFPSDIAVATPVQSAGTFNDLGENRCYENGVQIPCV